MRSLLDRNYHQLLTDSEIETLNSHAPFFKFNPDKGLQGMRSDKITWAHTLCTHPDILASFEEQLSNMAEEDTPDPEHRTSQPQSPLPLNP
jgi:hypothetical protein